MILHKLVPLPAVEVLITRNEGKEFLLADRHDQWWNGWHIPGSYMRRNESFENVCNRVARDEVGIGSITNPSLVGVHKWTSHPFGAPVSIVLSCQPAGEIIETEKLKFFSSIPPSAIPVHAIFLDFYLSDFRRRGNSYRARIIN